MRALLAVSLASCGGPARPPVTPTPVANHPSPQTTPAVAPSDALLAWPVAPFTAAQMAEVVACDTGKLATARYPKALQSGQLVGAFAVKTACDRATLAAACNERGAEGKPADPACLEAYRAVVKTNPAFAFSNGLLGYFGKLTLVAPPPIAAQKLASVKLTYAWSGLGTGVKWTVTAHDLTTTPVLEVVDATPKNGTKWTPELAASIEGFRTALVSFMPIAKPLDAVDCTDNYPDWSAVLTFADGHKLELSTHSSNLLGLGGPWQLALDGKTYLQLGPDLIKSIVKLVKTLDLPIGEPQGEFCRGFDLQAAILTP